MADDLYDMDLSHASPEAFVARKFASLAKTAMQEGRLDQFIDRDLPQILGQDVPPEVAKALKQAASGDKPSKPRIELTRNGGQPAVLASSDLSPEEVTLLVEKEIGTAVSLEPIQARTDGRALYRIRPR